jgi:hypothetical protein
VESEFFGQNIIYACNEGYHIHYLSTPVFPLTPERVARARGIMNLNTSPNPEQTIHKRQLMQYVQPRSSWNPHRSSHCRIIRPFEFCHQSVYLSPIDSRDLLCLHIGHCPFEESCLIHSTMQC